MRSAWGKMPGQARNLRIGADGSALVESALSISVLLTVMVGIMQLCLVLYASIFVNEAAREATRYASVRGSLSCIDLVSFPNCNMYSPSAGTVTATNIVGTNPLQTYVQGLGYPLPNKNSLGVTATWYYISQDSSQQAQWPAACYGLIDPGPSATPPGGGNPCNYPGNMVTVKVTYSIPMYIPFWSNANVTLTSTSSMLISQ